MSNNHAYDKLVEHIRMGGVLESVMDHLEWDQRTIMPKGDTERRSEQLEHLQRLLHRHMTSPVIGELIEKVHVNELTEEERANVREISRDYEKQCRVPEELDGKMAHAASMGSMIWEEAKKTNDFKLFLPHLETLVALAKERAGAIDPGMHPYDVCLDEYEPSASVNMYVELFDAYRSTIPDLIQNLELRPLSPKLQKLRERQVKLYRKHAYLVSLAEYIGYNDARGVIARSEHPFSSLSGRIAYGTEENWVNSIGSVLHEVGHAKYEHGLPQEHFGTPIGSTQSLSVHESQSRLWENHIGKSRAFWEGQYPHLVKGLKPMLRWVKLNEFYSMINHVEPSHVRVDADELTYGLHVLLRFEIEFDLIGGHIEVRDIPELWRVKSKEYLGITPPTDTLGCLQDIHWATACFGYFPTYLYGSMLAAQLWEALERGVPRRDWLVRNGDFRTIDEWLSEYIWSRGRCFSTSELIFRATGEVPTSSHYLRYLTEKYTELYK